jgi:hypothetical protein
MPAWAAAAGAPLQVCAALRAASTERLQSLAGAVATFVYIVFDSLAIDA